MNRIARRFFLTAFIAAMGGVLSGMSGPVFAQANTPEAGRGLPQDWSHKHLLYPNPDTRDEAARKGSLAFEHWNENYKDPRFALQVARKTRFVQATEESPFSPEQLEWANRHRRDPPPAGPDIHRDWSYVLGGANSGVGTAGVFPAKYNFDINAAASCANDFVVYTTAASGAADVAGVLASRTGTFTGNPTNAQTVTIANGTTRTIILTASTTLNTGTNFLIGGTTTITATNLAAAIVRNGNTAGVTATSAAAVVTITAITHGAGGNSITLAKTLTNFTWAGATLTGGTGTAGQPTIVAFNQLYSSCGATVPATYWSFNTGAAVTQTSPVLSLDGKQVAFVQSAGTAASLVLLKWSSTGTLGAPAAPASVTLANYRACAAPCMTVIAFNTGPNDTNSSPFYDYINDILYVGDDSGKLHKFTGVFFNGTPAEVIVTWPVTVSAANILSSPVYDSVSGLVFVGSAAGAATGGQLHSVNAATGALVSSGALSAASSVGVHDSPIVDSTAKRVYVFVGSGSGAANGSTCTGGPCLTVYQFSAPFVANNTGTNVQVGRSRTTSPGNVLYSGGFDNAYYTSGTPSSPSGNLYVCGSRTGTVARPTLWKIPITANAMGAPVIGPLIAGANTDCSPITEVMNGANDYIYASLAAGGNQTVCAGACIYLFNLTGLTWGATAVAGAGLAATGGTSGIIIDNISATAGASQIYYSTLTSPGNAIQASQAALQ